LSSNYVFLYMKILQSGLDLKMFLAKVDLRYTVWLFWDYDKGYI